MGETAHPQARGKLMDGIEGEDEWATGEPSGGMADPRRAHRPCRGERDQRDPGTERARPPAHDGAERDHADQEKRAGQRGEEEGRLEGPADRPALGAGRGGHDHEKGEDLAGRREPRASGDEPEGTSDVALDVGLADEPASQHEEPEDRPTYRHGLPHQAERPQVDLDERGHAPRLTSERRGRRPAARATPQPRRARRRGAGSPACAWRDRREDPARSSSA